MRIALARGLKAALLIIPLLPPGQIQAAELRGLLVYGHEACSLQWCEDNQAFWVNASRVLHGQIEKGYRSHARGPYDPVYVELDGSLGGRSTEGFAADYDGTVEVRAVRAMNREGIDACRRNARTAATPKPRTYVFLCGDEGEFTVRATATEAWVFRPEGTLRLPAVPAPETAETRYTNEAFDLLIDGDAARFGLAGEHLASCRNDPHRAVWEHAKLGGADFRAVGNEPGWNLEIRNGARLVLVTDYGASRLELPLPEPVADQTAGTTRWDAGELILDVTGRPCRDSMSGESFESEVVVTWGERTLRGCGRALH